MNSADGICLNAQYATTRSVYRERPRIANQLSARLQTKLFLPAETFRHGEGGLRTQGYFKKHRSDKPLISVITIVLNGREYIERTIQSVLDQSYEVVEYLIIDGGSTDGTLDVIRRYENAIDYWVSEPDSGISDAFNKGLAASTGHWINYMNCGDYFVTRDALARVAENADEGKDVIFGRGSVVDRQGRTILTAGKAFEEKRFSRRMTIPHQSCFHNRSFFLDHGVFDRELKVTMVYDLLLRKKPLRTVFVNQVFSSMLAGGLHEAEDYVRLTEMRKIKARSCYATNRFVVEFDYWYGLIRALVKRMMFRIGLRKLAVFIRTIESRCR